MWCNLCGAQLGTDERYAEPLGVLLCIEYLVGEYGTEPIADREPRSGRHEAVCHGGRFRQKLTFDVVRLRVEGWLLSIQT